MDQTTPELNRGAARGYNSPAPRTAEQIRADIARHRSDMDLLADSLRERVSPKQIAQEVKRSMQSRTSRLASATVSSVREHPIPWLVMGLGAVALVKEMRGSGQDPKPFGWSASSRLPAMASGSSYGEDHGVIDTVKETAETVKEKAGDLKDKVADALDTGKEKVVHAKEAVAEKANEAGAKLSDLGVRTRGQLKATADERPLLVALGLLGLGIALGVSIPTSQKEDELLGPTRDHLLEQAKAKGQEVVAKVSNVAAAVTKEASHRVEAKKDADPGQKMVSAVEGAVDAGRREAQRQGLVSSAAPAPATSPGSGAAGSKPAVSPPLAGPARPIGTRPGPTPPTGGTTGLGSPPSPTRSSSPGSVSSGDPKKDGWGNPRR